MIVVDASVVVDLFVGGSRGDKAAAALVDYEELFAPAHALVEAVSAFGRLERAGTLTTIVADNCVDQLGRAPITLIDPQRLLSRSWEHRRFLRLADAFYVACAEELSLPLLTSDRRLARAVEGTLDVRLVI